MARGIINVLVGFDVTSSFSDGGTFGAFKRFVNGISHGPQFLGAVGKMVAWDYNFLEGPYVYVKYLLIYPLPGGMILAFVRMALNR